MLFVAVQPAFWNLHLMVSGALTIAGVAAAIVSIALRRATTADHGRGMRNSGWSIVLMVDGVLLLTTAVALACL